MLYPTGDRARWALSGECLVLQRSHLYRELPPRSSSSPRCSLRSTKLSCSQRQLRRQVRAQAFATGTLVSPFSSCLVGDLCLLARDCDSASVTFAIHLYATQHNIPAPVYMSRNFMVRCLSHHNLISFIGKLLQSHVA